MFQTFKPVENYDFYYKRKNENFMLIVLVFEQRKRIINPWHNMFNDGFFQANLSISIIHQKEIHQF